MPAKIKPKTRKEIDELLELVNWKMSTKKPCDCLTCMLRVSFFVSLRDALLWTKGKSPPELVKVIESMKKHREQYEKHHAAHAE